MIPIPSTTYIPLKEATIKYGISEKSLLDEADVAYCAAVFKAKYDLYGGQMAGVRIFDKDGNLYQVKYRDVAAVMRAE